MSTRFEKALAKSATVGKGIRLIEYVGLIVVLIATLFAAASELVHMFAAGRVGISDLLLLFMYLEMVSMVETYWRMGTLPVRMPLYIAMVGIARHLMVDSAYRSPWLMIAGASSIVLLAIGVLIVRYGHLRLPYESSDRTDRGGPHG